MQAKITIRYPFSKFKNFATHGCSVGKGSHILLAGVETDITFMQSNSSKTLKIINYMSFDQPISLLGIYRCTKWYMYIVI